MCVSGSMCNNYCVDDNEGTESRLGRTGNVRLGERRIEVEVNEE